MTPPKNIIDKLKKQLAHLDKAKGIVAQNSMSPIRVAADKYREAPEHHKTAAVMALLYPQNDEWHICYMLRTSHHPEDKHAGQISFPGGQQDADDISLESCALREVHEEIGLAASQIQVLGALTELYVFASNFLVFPFVGYCNKEPQFIPEPSEVAEIISFPIEQLISGELIYTKDLQVRNMTLKDVPYYDLNGHVLWGATAMITAELISLLKT